MKEIVVWSKANCPQCDMAKRLLKSKNIEFTENKIGDGYEVEDLRNIVPNASSVPQIIIDGEPIGGYNQLVKYLNQ